MSSPDADKVFAGSIPRLYESHLVPLLFEPYAAELVSRLVSLAPSRVLEVAAGTGVVTRAMASALPERVSIVATDLKPTTSTAEGTSARPGVMCGVMCAVTTAPPARPDTWA